MKTYTNGGEGVYAHRTPFTHLLNKYLSDIYESDPLRGRTRSQRRMRSAVLERMKNKPGEQCRKFWDSSRAEHLVSLRKREGIHDS